MQFAFVTVRVTVWGPRLSAYLPPLSVAGEPSIFAETISPVPDVTSKFAFPVPLVVRGRS